jgi:hypothetical protein
VFRPLSNVHISHGILQEGTARPLGMRITLTNTTDIRRRAPLSGRAPSAPST